MRMRGAAVAAVAALLGCGTATPTPTRDPGAAAPVTTYLAQETQLLDGRVDAQAQIPLQPRGPKPALIVMHGDTHAMVAAGFVAVTFKVKPEPAPPSPAPASPAPAAVGKWVLASPSAAVLGRQYLENIATTAETVVPAVLDWMTTLPDVDPTRLGMLGSSTNGFITLQATAADPRLRVAVAIAACGDYQRFLQFSSMGMEGRPLALAHDYARWLARQEVINHPDRLLHAAVLMVNRSGDPLIPVSCADETARVLSEAYARAGQPQRFRYLRLDLEGHGAGAEEVVPAREWLRQWLLPAAAPDAASLSERSRVGSATACGSPAPPTGAAFRGSPSPPSSSSPPRRAAPVSAPTACSSAPPPTAAER